jgi:peptide-methionine (R)-S-oxide reductase
MQRRAFISQLSAFVAAGAVSSHSCANDVAHEVTRAFAPLKTRNLPWHELLDAERFQILFLQETEFAGSSALNDENGLGTYICAACRLPLFHSQHKYDSGTGWPSFTQPIPTHIELRTDLRGREPIVEYHCARCGGHQGHRFDDGPPPRGERWCNNGLALLFIPSGKPLPALRE